MHREGKTYPRNHTANRDVALRQSSKCSRIFRLSVILLVIMLAAGTIALAQVSKTGDSKSESPGAVPQGKGQDLEELSKELNNPVSSVWNITTQSNMYFYKGDLSPAYRGQFVFNFQPVLPIPLTKNWILIPRPVIPILSNPYIRGGESGDWLPGVEPHRQLRGHRPGHPVVPQYPRSDPGLRPHLHFSHRPHP